MLRLKYITSPLRRNRLIYVIAYETQFGCNNILQYVALNIVVSLFLRKCKNTIVISDPPISNRMVTTVLWIHYRHGSEMILVTASSILANADTVSIVHHLV